LNSVLNVKFYVGGLGFTTLLGREVSGRHLDGEWSFIATGLLGGKHYTLTALAYRRQRIE
jgi:hypothetical protein